MKRIDISIREKNPLYHDRSRDIETALAWNAVKKALHEAGRDELFPYIQSVKVTEKYITLKTSKPLVIAELNNLLGWNTSFQKKLRIC